MSCQSFNVERWLQKKFVEESGMAKLEIFIENFMPGNSYESVVKSFIETSEKF